MTAFGTILCESPYTRRSPNILKISFFLSPFIYCILDNGGMSTASHFLLKGMPAAHNGTSPQPKGGGAPLSELVIVVNIILLLFPLFVVGLRYVLLYGRFRVINRLRSIRLYVRRYIVKAFGQDDFFIVIAIVSVIYRCDAVYPLCECPTGEQKLIFST
jgi:hypothetical protein